eukprot:TRINITY_DN26990_c0_g1_i1.p1 TRINITY_DN26990_c0_g1~~TRINITY_DN26990_c0_g1_i1.p1  ORF type:complete len:363 (+),score=15.03 TRINITY_DN26990_c0_g1_i1:121-1209(+)
MPSLRFVGAFWLLVVAVDAVRVGDGEEEHLSVSVKITDAPPRQDRWHLAQRFSRPIVSARSAPQKAMGNSIGHIAADPIEAVDNHIDKVNNATALPDIPNIANITDDVPSEPGALSNWHGRWVLERFITIGPMALGVPGFFSLAIYLNPLFEVVPRLHRERDVGHLPMLPYSAMASMSFIWVCYGGLTMNPALWVPNIVGVTVGLYYCMVYAKYCPVDDNWFGSRKIHHFSLIVFVFSYCILCVVRFQPDVALTYLGMAGNVFTILMFGGPLAAIGVVIEQQHTKSMPFGYSLVVTLNCCLWFFYAYFVLADWFIYFQDGLGLILASIQMCLFARYGIYWDDVEEAPESSPGKAAFESGSTS